MNESAGQASTFRWDGGYRGQEIVQSLKGIAGKALCSGFRLESVDFLSHDEMAAESYAKFCSYGASKKAAR